MKYLRLLFVVTYLLVLPGCHPGIKGRVIDSVTGMSIEGAVVVAEWTTTGGVIGLTHTSTYKIVETETDHAGAFSLSGVYNPFVSAPTMIIYKRGYAPWRNDIEFKRSAKLRDTVLWRDDMTYRLDPWREELSKGLLQIHLGYRLSGANQQSTPTFSEMTRDVE